MTELERAAAVALEALALPSMKTQAMLIQRDEAIDALRGALQLADEPVAGPSFRCYVEDLVDQLGRHQERGSELMTVIRSHEEYIEKLELELDTKSYHHGWIAGIEACMSRLHEMHHIATDRHNYYQHAAIEMAKLKEQQNEQTYRTDHPGR